LPLYEYQCKQCKAHLEKIQKFADPPLLKCPRCGGELERLLSSPAIQFKGSGWYITDYARKPAKETATTESKGAETTAKPSDGKAESSPKATETSKKSTEPTTAKK
jgi:putative FmdB family regulatory protein